MIIILLQQKDTNQNQPKEETHRVQSGTEKVPNTKLPFPQGCGTLLSLMCDNTHGVLPTWEVRLSLSVHSFYWGFVT